MHPTPVVPERDAWLLAHSSALLRPGETLYGALPVRLDPLVPDRIPGAAAGRNRRRGSGSGSRAGGGSSCRCPS